MSISLSDVVDYIKNLRLRDVSAFIENLEDDLEVFATPPMSLEAIYTNPMVPDVQTEFDVSISSFGDKKVQVIKVVRAATGLGLREAKAVVEALSTVREAISKHDAEALVEQLVAVGATAVVR